MGGIFWGRFFIRYWGGGTKDPQRDALGVVRWEKLGFTYFVN